MPGSERTHKPTVFPDAVVGFNTAIVEFHVRLIVFPANNLHILGDMLTNGSFPINNTIGKNIDDANNLRKIIDKIVQEYPFTEKFFQDGMKNVTCFLKKEIDKIELH